MGGPKRIEAPDYLAQPGAVALAARIRAWWAQQDCDIRPTIERGMVGDRPVFMVRLPPTAVPVLPPRHVSPLQRWLRAPVLELRT